MNQISLEDSNLYRAIAELAYAIAKADGTLDAKEQDAFKKIIEKELLVDDWVAGIRFDAIFTTLVPSVEESYKHAITLLRRNKENLTQALVIKFNNILRKVAEVSGISLEEQSIIERFNKDLNDMMAS